MQINAIIIRVVMLIPLNKTCIEISSLQCESFHAILSKLP